MENTKDAAEVSALYECFDEELRLTSKAGQIEYLTTLHHIEKHLKPGMSILDIGAGTGAYSLHFAKKGYEVTAIELVQKHVDIIKSKVRKDMNLTVHQGNALDLSVLSGQVYDLILCFGPLYHLEDDEDQKKVIHAIKSCSHDDTVMLYAFINNDMVIATETMCYNSSFLKEDSYNKKTFVLNNKPFVFHTVNDCRKLLKDCKIRVIQEIASDGFSELLAEKINKMDDVSYDLWLKYHLYCSDQSEFLGSSNHLLFIGKK